MANISSTVDIDADRETVWQVLTDGTGHADWDPHIESIEGTIAPGRRLTVKFRDSMTFRPTVQAVEAGRSLEWLGRLIIPGLFDGRHHWELESTETGTRVTQSEQFTGILVPFMGKLIRDTEQQFAASNAALAAQAEARTTSGT